MDCCTIVARNYLPYARVLADSFHAHHPGAVCHVLVLDGPPGDGFPPHFRAWTPGEAGIAELPEMAASYEVTELATAVKPAFLRRLLRDSPELVYLDPDISVHAPLTTVSAALARGPIVLNPHLTEPLPDDGKRPDDQDILLAGAYNLGFLALRAGDDADALLTWWTGRLREHCRIDIPAGLFVDQRWIDLVPGLFPATELLLDPGCNVAYWNLPHRRLSSEDGALRVDGEPLRFFHFSGFDLSRPDRLSRHQTRRLVDDQPALRGVLRSYARDVLAAAAGRTPEPYGFDRLPNGLALTFAVRAGHRRWRREGGAGNVWEEAGARAFTRWLGEPEPGARPGVSRYLHELHRARRDLRDAFPIEEADGAARYLAWVGERGRVEIEIPPRFLPPLPAGARAAASITGRRWAHVVRHRVRGAAHRMTLRLTRR